MKNWILFIYDSGANPYIVTTEKEFKRIKRKYKGKIKKIDKENYYIFDKEEKDKNAGILYPLF